MYDYNSYTDITSVCVTSIDDLGWHFIGFVFDVDTSGYRTDLTCYIDGVGDSVVSMGNSYIRDI